MIEQNATRMMWCMVWMVVLAIIVGGVIFFMHHQSLFQGGVDNFGDLIRAIVSQRNHGKSNM
jgi:hypothetical protein